MLSALTQSQKIPDSNVHLPASEDEPAFVRSSKQSHLEYAVYNPCTEWAVCECVHSQKGNICKHQLKVLRMTRPNIAEGNIAKYLGSLRGTTQGRFKNMIAHADGQTPFNELGSSLPLTCAPSPPHTSLKPELGERFEDDDDHMHQLVVKVVERAYKYLVVKHHLIADLVKAHTIHRGIEVQIENNVIHPAEVEATPFRPASDTGGMRLKRLYDFLEVCGWRTCNVRPRINVPTLVDILGQH